MRLTCGVPALLPSLMAHAMAESEYGIHVFAFPSHAAAFPSGLDHTRVGALHYPRADGPASTSKEWSAQEEPSCAHGVEMLANLLAGDVLLWQARDEADESVRTTTGEDVDTTLEHAHGKDAPVRSPCLQERVEVFSRMRDIETPNRMRTMDLHTRLESLGSVHHRTDLFGLHEAAAPVDVSQRGNGGRIGSARARREVPDVDLLRVG